MFAHGTDSGTDNYAITFGLYTDKDNSLRWYTSDISRVNSSAFAKDSISKFYSCRTGNTFENGNFAQQWANKTGGNTYAYKGYLKSTGRSDYEDILGTLWERHGISTDGYKNWQKNRGEVDKKPGSAWRYPKASSFTYWELFTP